MSKIRKCTTDIIYITGSSTEFSLSSSTYFGHEAMAKTISCERSCYRLIDLTRVYSLVVRAQGHSPMAGHRQMALRRIRAELTLIAPAQSVFILIPPHRAVLKIATLEFA